jgi:hypothetical protein
MVSIPALTARARPSVPWAWAAMCRPRRWASSAMARRSSTGYCARPTLLPGVIPPPVAQILMKSASSLTSRRTARRPSSAVSDS